MKRTDIERLYGEYAPYLFKRCRKFLGNDEDAYDALQEVFVRVLRRSEGLDDPATLLPWLNRVTTNYCLNVIRYRSYRRFEDGVALERVADDDADVFVALSEQNDLVTWLLSSSPEKLRDVAVCYFLEEMTLAEVAEDLDISVATVRRRVKSFVERGQREIRRLREAEKRSMVKKEVES